MAYADSVDEYGYGQQDDPYQYGAPPPAPMFTPMGPATTPTGKSDAEIQALMNTAPQAAAAPGYSGPKDFPSIVSWWKATHPAANPDIAGLMAVLSQQGLQ